MPPKALSIKTNELPECVLVYILYKGPFQNNPDLFKNLFTQLMARAEPGRMLPQPGVEMITVYHDDPDITPEAKQRISIEITVPDRNNPDEHPLGKHLVDICVAIA